MDMLWSMVLKLSGNTMDVNIMDVNASMTIPMNTFIFNKNGLSEKQNWKPMVAKSLKWNAVNGENNWDIFDEILRKPNLGEFYVSIIRLLHWLNSWRIEIDENQINELLQNAFQF